MAIKRGMMFVLAAGLAAAAIGMSISRGSTSFQAQSGPSSKSAESPSESSAKPRFKAPIGTLQASRIKELRFTPKRLDGTSEIIEIADQGEYLSVGDTVVKLLLPEFERARGIAEQEYRVAELAMIAAEVDFKNRQDEAEVRLARVELDFARAKYDLDYWNQYGMADEIKRAEMGLQGHVDGIADQEEELAQLEDLYKGNELASESQKIVLERARRRLQRAKDSYEIAKHVNEYTIKQSIPRTDWERNEAFKRADSLLTRAKADEEAAVGAKEAAAVRARMALEAATRKVAELAEDSDNDTIYAPFSGLVLHGPMKDNDGASRGFSFGDQVAKSAVVATVLDVENLEVTVQVPLVHIQEFRAAESLLAVADDTGVEATAPASIASISGIVRNGFVSVRVSVDNADMLLMHGQSVRIEIGK